MRPAKRFAFLAVALLLTTAVAVIGGTSFQRRIADFQPVGFEHEADQGAWRVTAVSHPETGVQVGDEIYLVHGERAASPIELAQLLRSRPSGEMLVLRESLDKVTYTRPELEIDVAYLVLAAIGVIYLLIGLFTALKDRHLRARLFFLWCLAYAAFYVVSPPPIPADSTDLLSFAVDQMARSLLPALTLHLFLIFPTPLVAGRGLRLALPGIYLPAALSLAFHADQIFANGGWLFGPASSFHVALVDRLELYFLVAASLLACLALIVRLARRPEWEQRRQVHWLVAGMLGGYLPFLFLYVAPHALGLTWPRWTTVAAVLPLALVPLAFAYAILKYKLWDIGVILRDTIAYSLTVLVGLSGFALINLAIERGTSEELSLLRNLLTFAAGLVIAGVLVPAKNVIASNLERFQYRTTLPRRRALSGLGPELLHERDLDRLCTTLIDRLADGLVVRANLFLAQGGAMVPVEPAEALPRQLGFDAFGDRFWGRDVAAISSVHLPAAEPSAQQRLFGAGYRYALPLVVRDHRVGVVLLSYKYDEEPLSSEDLELSRDLLDQAALAIENAQLLEEVHRQLQEVTRLERHTQGILESSPAGIAVIDTEDRVQSANHAFAVIAGTRRPETLGRPLSDLLPVKPLPDLDAGVVEVSFCELSGEERYLQLSVASYLGGDQRVVIVQDVSERMEMEHQVKEKERLASLGMLAAGVAHEVNTPLTGISSYAQLLLADIAEDDPRREILRKMERQTFRAAQIVNNLLEFARNRRAEYGPVNLGRLLSDCCDTLRERAGGVGVILDWQPPADGAVVAGHDGELVQVFTNLMVNALDAMSTQPNGVERRLSLALEDRGATVRATVADTGPGIPTERLERIFQPFYSSKLTRGGSGLGLAITYNIVRRHGGEIGASNRLDGHVVRGCTFTVDLPRHDPPSS